MSYFTFKVGTFLHRTLPVLNMQVNMFLGEAEVCAVLQQNTVGSTHCYTTCPPCVNLLVSYIPLLSPGYILWVTSEQLWRCLGTV